MKLTINQLFNYSSGNYALTEEVIYNQKPTSDSNSIPIFSGSDNNEKPIGYINRDSKNKKGQEVKIFQGPCIILTKDGSSGLMTFRSKGQGEFTINHHACILTLKEKWKNKVDIEWFSYQYNDKLYRYATSKSDNRVLSTQWFERVKFYILDYKDQLDQKEKRNTLYKYQKELQNCIQNINKVLHKTKLSVDGKKRKIDDIFHFKSGNYGLTEEFIYHNLPTSEYDRIPIYSSATQEENSMGSISRKARPKDQKLKIYSGPCILVSRNGYAGKMKVLNDEEFCINDHAYVLIIKKKWKNKINLRWFAFQYQDLFLNIVTSKSDNATFNKTYAGKQIIEIPDISFQNKLAVKFSKLDQKETLILEFKDQLENLIFSEVET